MGGKKLELNPIPPKVLIVKIVILGGLILLLESRATPATSPFHPLRLLQ